MLVTFDFNVPVILRAYVEKYLLEKSRLVYQEHNERWAETREAEIPRRMSDQTSEYRLITSSVVSDMLRVDILSPSWLSHRSVWSGYCHVVNTFLTMFTQHWFWFLKKCENPNKNESVFILRIPFAMQAPFGVILLHNQKPTFKMWSGPYSMLTASCCSRKQLWM